jgi:hypothetical protein
MGTLTVERAIAAPPAEVFDWLADSRNYTRAPLVLREHRRRDGETAPYGVGAVRTVTALGAWFLERITAFDPPHEFRYLIVKSLPPIEHHGASVRITPITGGSHVLWTTSYDVPLASGGRVLDAVFGRVLTMTLRRIMLEADRALAGLGSSRG